MYVASLELPCVRTFGHIGASHVASVLELPVDEQQSMLVRAERERLSVRELRAQVDARRTSGVRRGRPALAAATRTISAIEADARRLSGSICRLDALDVGGDPAARERLAALVTLLKNAGAHLSRLTAGPTEFRRTSELRLRDTG